MRPSSGSQRAATTERVLSRPAVISETCRGVHISACRPADRRVRASRASLCAACVLSARLSAPVKWAERTAPGRVASSTSERRRRVVSGQKAASGPSGSRSVRCMLMPALNIPALRPVAPSPSMAADSSTSTWAPALEALKAALRPATPPPITTTSTVCAGSDRMSGSSSSPGTAGSRSFHQGICCIRSGSGCVCLYDCMLFLLFCGAGASSAHTYLFSQEFSAFVAQELSDGCWIVFIKSHLLEVGQHCTPLFFGGEIAIIPAHEIFKDAALQFMPCGAVASIDVAAFRDIVLVVGVVVDAHVERTEVVGHYLLHMWQVEGAGIEVQCTNQLNLHERAQRAVLVFVCFALAVVFQASVKGVWLIQPVHAQFVAHKRTAFANKMCGMVIARRFVGVDHFFWLASVNFDEIIAAILPCRLFGSPCLSRARVIYPAIKFIRLVDMAQRQVIHAGSQRLKL